jgi:hypothetical protein
MTHDSNGSLHSDPWVWAAGQSYSHCYHYWKKLATFRRWVTLCMSLGGWTESLSCKSDLIFCQQALEECLKWVLAHLCMELGLRSLRTDQLWGELRPCVFQRNWDATPQHMSFWSHMLRLLFPCEKSVRIPFSVHLNTSVVGFKKKRMGSLVF